LIRARPGVARQDTRSIVVRDEADASGPRPGSVRHGVVTLKL
jgi:hypothetical protein